MATQKELARETNARFWIETGYKPGVSLNPADSGDKFMARRWVAIYRDLARQNQHGTLTLIHKHSTFAERLVDAIRAYQIEVASDAKSQRYAEARAAKAQALHEAVLWRELLTTSGREQIT